MKISFEFLAELRLGKHLKNFVESARLHLKLFLSGGRKDEK